MRTDPDRGRCPTTSLSGLRGVLLGRALALLAALTLVSCGGDGGPTAPEPDPPLAPATGSLEVTTSTVAGGLDSDAFRVALDGGEERTIGTDAAETFADVEAGDHTVELSGLAAGCAVADGRTRGVTVPPDDEATVTYEVTCGARDRLSFRSLRDGRIDIYVTSPDGSAPLRRLTDDGNNTGHAWSPDGSRIAFASNRNGDFDIWMMEADGSNPENLTARDAGDAGPAWSPDGTRIAFTSNTDDDLPEVWVMDADGSDLRNVTRHEANDQGSAWSPDGSRIAFSSSRGGSFDIWVMDVDGSSPPERLTDSDSLDVSPAWSPDGSLIAFVSERDGNDEIYVMPADGSGPPENLTEDDADDGFPAWSPDGTRIAFDSDRGGSFDIWVMNADGSDPRAITRDAALDFQAAWSPTSGAPPSERTASAP